MLEEIHIRGLGVIDDAVLPLGPGLSVVTGETGAGKTMVVTGLLLLFGGRADSARVRTGADQAGIDGRLELDPASPAIERVRAAGGELDDGTGLVLRRTVSAAGRSRAYVGGTAAPVAVLGEIADSLLAVHGQSDQLRLTRGGEQRAVLDRFAGTDSAAYVAAYDEWRVAEAQLHERTSRTAELRREADILTFGLAEIAAVEPQPGEDIELTALSSRLGHADALRIAARAAHDAILGDADDPTGDAVDVLSLLGAAARALGQQSGADPILDALAVRLTDLSAAAVDIGSDLGSYGDQLDADPGRLEQVEQRRAALLTLVRKYADGPEQDVDAVLRWSEQAALRLDHIDVSDEALAALATERDRTRARAAHLAGELSAARRAAGAQLAAAVTVELHGLAMPAAQLTVAVRPRPATAGTPTLEIDGAEVGATADGVDEVELLLQSHPDAPALPIAKGASGGELSRVMLALEVCLAGTSPVPTLVFDEVDAGVGGRAAVEIGRRLSRLSRDHQVIVVTHLAQVAAYADRHLVVDKPLEAAVTASDVRLVTGADRVAELARMLAGSESGTALEHAAELLDSATKDRETARRPTKSRRTAKTRG